MDLSAPVVTIIIPVHNRRETTINCLRHLHKLGRPEGMDVCIVDDGSTDGTAEAVRIQFPEITLLAGDGQLWWAGAIARGMQYAFAQGAEFAVWLNDDTLPEPGALAALIGISRERQAITGGACYLPGEKDPAYGGLFRRWGCLSRVLSSTEATIACDALSGNLVCIPRLVFDRIGGLDARHMPHGFADLDYSLRARAAGVPVLLVGAARACAQPNLSLNYRSWLHSDVPIGEWWRQLGRRGSFIYQPALWRFHLRHWGVKGGLYCIWMLLKLTLITLLRLVVPRSWLLHRLGKHSAAWRHEQLHCGAGPGKR